ncbi:hypothetical protein [Tissierella sp.]|uniref:hypothetical protein n=1 Tax=Tissierella sp. TaxID=41274 RepID=UPI0028AD0FD3|nr:hypothetical protein [Tissierella sp.]
MEKIKHLFNEEQLKMFEKLGKSIEDRAYSDDEILELEDLIADRLMYSGFDEDYNPNEEGKICESILDVFGDM